MSDDRRNLIAGNLPEETVAALQDARMPNDAMSDDIVKRLRAAGHNALMDEAAAEIERLREEIEQLLGPYRLAAQAMSDESQHNAQLEGLAFGLEQRGEVSAAHVIRLALKRLDRCHER